MPEQLQPLTPHEMKVRTTQIQQLKGIQSELRQEYRDTDPQLQAYIDEIKRNAEMAIARIGKIVEDHNGKAEPKPKRKRR